MVFVHGKDARRGAELKSPTFALAHCLSDAGLAVLMIDLRGHGMAGWSRGTGDPQRRRPLRAGGRRPPRGAGR